LASGNKKLRFYRQRKPQRNQKSKPRTGRINSQHEHRGNIENGKAQECSGLCPDRHYFLLIIPEIILRVCTSEQLGRLSDFTSLGGLLNPLLSLLIFRHCYQSYWPSLLSHWLSDFFVRDDLLSSDS
jgi:hypothetical protein